MADKTIHVVRECLTEHATLSRIFVDGTWRWYGLEDALRVGPKVPGETCISAGRYRTRINFSNRFQRRLPILENVPGFTGVRFHPGNTIRDTRGCILVGGGYRINSMEILHSLFAVNQLQDQIQKWLDVGEAVWTEVVDPMIVPGTRDYFSGMPSRAGKVQ